MRYLAIAIIAACGFAIDAFLFAGAAYLVVVPDRSGWWIVLALVLGRSETLAVYHLVDQILDSPA